MKKFTIQVIGTSKIDVIYGKNFHAACEVAGYDTLDIVILREETLKTDRQKALETLEKVKRIYDGEGGDLLSGGFWAEFMHL